MTQLVTTPCSFKPFLVEGGRDGKTIFRIQYMCEEVTRAQVEQFFEKLPFGFRLRGEKKLHLQEEDDLREPLEVYIDSLLVQVYPARGRVLSCVNMDSWDQEEVVRQMHVHNLFDATSPGGGQISSSVSFNPEILGIENWPGTQGGLHEVDLQCCMFHREKSEE